MARAPLPLKLGARRVAKNVGTGAQQIISGDFKSRYLRLFRGANRQNLALLEFYDIYDAAPDRRGQRAADLRGRHAGDGQPQSRPRHDAVHEFLA